MTVWDLIGFAFSGLLLVALYLLYRWQVHREATLAGLLALGEQRQRLQEQSLSGLTAASAGVDRRLARLEAKGAALSERQDAVESQQAEERPYQHAIRLVRQGASAQRLIEELQLSESEAELIVRLHGAAPAAHPAER